MNRPSSFETAWRPPQDEAALNKTHLILRSGVSRVSKDEAPLEMAPFRPHIPSKAHWTQEDTNMDEKTLIEIQADAFRGLVKHLQKRTDAQNIDIMNTAGFCRNCLSKWLVAAAEARDVDLSPDEAREMIYGMPYDEYKSKYQEKASDEQMEKFEASKPLHADISGHN